MKQKKHESTIKLNLRPKVKLTAEKVAEFRESAQLNVKKQFKIHGKEMKKSVALKKHQSR